MWFRPCYTKSRCIDRYIQQRVHAKANQAHYGADLHLSTAYKTAIDNAMELKNRRHTMTFTSGSLSNQLSCAVDAIAKGVSRCASVAYIGEGDSWMKIIWTMMLRNLVCSKVSFRDSIN